MAERPWLFRGPWVGQEGCLGPSAGEKPSVSIRSLYFRKSLLLVKYLTCQGRKDAFKAAQVGPFIGFEGNEPTEQDNGPQTGSGAAGRREPGRGSGPDISTARLWRPNTLFSRRSLELPSLPRRRFECCLARSGFVSNLSRNLSRCQVA